MRQLIYALQTESENVKPKALPSLIFPKSISEALLSPEPWSLSFQKKQWKKVKLLTLGKELHE